jgi:hypothetical protein
MAKENRTEIKPGRGAPLGNKNHLKHGFYVYKAMLNGDGLDERSSLFKALREKENELVTSLGGDPSPQERIIISDSIKNILYIASMDNYLMGMKNIKSLVRKGKPHPCLTMRTQLASHLRDNLKTLGLHRRVKQTSLTEILSQHDEENTDLANVAKSVKEPE